MVIFKFFKMTIIKQKFKLKKTTY